MLKTVVGTVALGSAAVFGIGAVDNTTRDNSGSIVEAGELGAFVMQVGDCFFDLPQDTDAISTVPGVPCTEAHHWQVVHKENISLDEYNLSSVSELASQVCDYALQEIASTLSYAKQTEYQNALISSLQPTEGSWLKEDRTVDCLVGSENESYFSSILE